MALPVTGPGIAASAAGFRSLIRQVAARPAARAAFGLAVLVACLCHRALFRAEVYYQRDIQFMWYTKIEAAVRSVAGGRWPVWDPFTAFGQPLWADANLQLLYPFTWLNLLARPWTVYTLFVTAHLLWAGLGLYALARRWGMGALAATVAGSVWVASGPLLSEVNLWNQLAGAAWMPWIARAGDRALAVPSLRRSTLWGLTVAAPILAGSPEAVLMAGGLVLARLPSLWIETPATRRRRWPQVAGWAGVLGLLASAAQWVPALEVARRSARVDLPEAVRTYWSIHPLNLLQAWWPIPLDRAPISFELRTLLFEGREPFLASLYLGLPTLLLVVCAARAGRRRLTPALAALGLAALVCALGRHAPAYEFLAAILPPLRALRYPAKAMALVSLCAALLAGIGLDRWAGGVRPPRLSRILVAGGAGATLALSVLLWLGSPLVGGPLGEILGVARSTAGSAAVLTLTLTLLGSALLLGHPGGSRPALVVGLACAVELLVANAWLNPTAPRELYSVRPPLLDRVASPQGGRLYVYDYFVAGKSVQYLGRPMALTAVRGPARWPFNAVQALALRLYLFPPSAGAWGREGSYDRDVAGLAPTPLAQLTDLLRVVEGTPAHLRLLRMGAVSHVVALHQRGFEDLRPRGQLDALFAEPVRIFEVPAPLPRAHVVSGVRVADGLDAMQVLLETDFEPAREVLLAEGVPRPAAAGFSGQARVISREADHLSLEAALPSEGFLVLADAYDPGWRATVDGIPAPVLRANVGFRALKLAAGAHRIELSYRPAWFGESLGLSVAAWLTAALAWRVSRRQARAAPP